MRSWEEDLILSPDVTFKTSLWNPCNSINIFLFLTRSTGFILEDFPRTEAEARYLSSSGLFPDIAVILVVEDTEIVDRLLPPLLDKWCKKRDKREAEKERQRALAKKQKVNWIIYLLLTTMQQFLISETALTAELAGIIVQPLINRPVQFQKFGTLFLMAVTFGEMSGSTRLFLPIWTFCLFVFAHSKGGRPSAATGRKDGGNHGKKGWKNGKICVMFYVLTIIIFLVA